MDTLLLNLVSMAESDRETPSVNVITSSGEWIRGLPCSYETFRKLSWSQWVGEVTTGLEKRPRREKKNAPLDPNEVAREPFKALGPHDDPGAPVLSLRDAFLSFGGRSDGLELPAIRIPVAAVSSWWVAGHSYVKPDSSGGGLGLGVLVPLPN